MIYKARNASIGGVLRVITFAQNPNKQINNMMHKFYNLLQINSLQL